MSDTGSKGSHGPWVELHLHMEGAAPPEVLRSLPGMRADRLAGLVGPDGSYAFEDFAQFLHVYEMVSGMIRGPQAYAALTEAVAAARAADGVIYAEVFVAPEFCGRGDLAAWREHLAAIREAAATARARHGIEIRVIATAIRHLGPEAARAAARCAAETAEEGVVGFGMGGDERRGTPAQFAYAFDMAREAGLGLTVHAGEWAGPGSVRATLDTLRPHRLGHGVRAVEDPALVTRLAEAGTVLEICCGSNIALGLYPDWPAHPVGRLRQAGVALTLSTDDPPFFATSLAAEADRLASAFGWRTEDFRAINRVAAEAAFCDAPTRDMLVKRLETADA